MDLGVSHESGLGALLTIGVVQCAVPAEGTPLWHAQGISRPLLVLGPSPC